MKKRLKQSTKQIPTKTTKLVLDLGLESSIDDEVFTFIRRFSGEDLLESVARFFAINENCQICYERVATLLYLAAKEFHHPVSNKECFRHPNL